MRAVILTGFGGFDRLELRTDWPVPRPAAGQVLIKVGAAAINNTDINTRIGWYSKAVNQATDAGSTSGFAEAQVVGWSGDLFSFPRIQGIDCCGHIVGVGAGIDSDRIGERVLVDPMFHSHAGKTGYFGSEYDGAFAEFAVVPASNAYAIQCEWTDAELASFPCSYSTAENILTRIGLKSGERVLITGASGGVGAAAIQLAKRRGATVTAITSIHKAQAVGALGADQIIGRDADLLQETGHEQFDAVVDIVGGAQFPALIQCLKRNGRYGVSGAIAGPVVSLDLRDLYLKDIRVFGCTALTPEVFPNLIRYIEKHEIRPAIDAVFPLEDIISAQQLFLEKHHVGKIVLSL
jgi:NADPH:quinone reductase-like Zn-dependent oxidoreductase